MQSFSSNASQFGTDTAEQNQSFSRFPEISLQQIQQLQGQQPSSPSTASMLSNTPVASQLSSPSMSAGVPQKNFNQMPFYSSNSMFQTTPNPNGPSTSSFPDPSPILDSQQFSSVFQSSDSSLPPSMIDSSNFNLNFSLNPQSSDSSLLFQDSNGISTDSQPFSSQFQALPEVKPSIQNYNDISLYPSSSQKKNPLIFNKASSSSTFQSHSLANRSAGVSPIPTGLEVLESSHAKHHKKHLRIKPQVEHAEISKKSPHAGHFSRHNSVSGLSGISPSSSASTPISSSTTSSSSGLLRTSPNYPCPEDWAPLPTDYYANVPDFYPPIPPPNSSALASSSSTNSTGATTRLDGADLEFYLESLTIYPRLLYEISTEHGANIFSRKMSWSLLERSGKVYHELLSGRRLRNTFLHRISRYENRKNACKDRSSTRKGAKGEKGSGYRTYSPKIDRLLGQILDLQNHLRECKLTYYEQKHKAESTRKTKRDLPNASSIPSGLNTIKQEKKEKIIPQSFDNSPSTNIPSFDSRNQSNNYSTDINDINNSILQNEDTTPNFSNSIQTPFSGEVSFEPKSSRPRAGGSSISEATSYLTLAAEKPDSQDFPMPQESFDDDDNNQDDGSDERKNVSFNESQESIDTFTNLSSLDNIRVDINPAALAMHSRTSSVQFTQPAVQEHINLITESPKLNTTSDNLDTMLNNQPDFFFSCTHPHLHHHPSDPGYYTRVMKDMEIEVQKAIEDAVQRVKELELGEAKKREQSYNKRLNDVTQKLLAVEQSVDELKTIVKSIRNNDAQNCTATNQNQFDKDEVFRRQGMFDGNFMGDGRDFSDFDYTSSSTKLDREKEESPISSGAIDDEEIDRLIQKERDRQERQEIQKRAHDVVDKLKMKLLHKQELDRFVESRQAFSGQQKLPSIQEQDSQPLIPQLVSPSSSSSSLGQQGSKPGSTGLDTSNFQAGGSSKKYLSGQQKLPVVQHRASNLSLHNSSTVSRSSPALQAKESPPSSAQPNSLQLTPTTSNTLNSISVSNSNTSDSGAGYGSLEKFAQHVTNGRSRNGSETSLNPVTSVGQNSNFGLSFLRDFSGDDGFVQEIVESEDEDGPDISECL